MAAFTHFRNIKPDTHPHIYVLQLYVSLSHTPRIALYVSEKHAVNPEMHTCTGNCIMCSIPLVQGKNKSLSMFWFTI